MIKQIMRYGHLDKPESSKPVEVISNPLEAIVSSYQLWLPIAKRSNFTFGVNMPYNEGLADNLYMEACKLLIPHAGAFQNVKPAQINKILSTIKPIDTNAFGLYLSALLNATDLEQFNCYSNQRILGYKLDAGKKLVVGRRPKIEDLGRYGKGEIINNGKIHKMAFFQNQACKLIMGKFMKWHLML